MSCREGFFILHGMSKSFSNNFELTQTAMLFILSFKNCVFLCSTLYWLFVTIFYLSYIISEWMDDYFLKSNPENRTTRFLDVPFIMLNLVIWPFLSFQRNETQIGSGRKRRWNAVSVVELNFKKVGEKCLK